MKSLIVSSIAALALAAQAQAIEIVPVSYSFDQATDTGSYAYHDWTGNQLTDGEYGIAPWSANLGNGPAYEWLGWTDSMVNIDFVFAGAHLISQIAIGTVQDNVADVVIPNAYLFSSSDGVNWDFLASSINPESSANNGQHKTLTFNGLNISDDYVRVQVAHSYNGPWTFVDEVDFYGENGPAGVPDSGTTLALLGAGMVGLLGARRRLNR